MVAGNVLPFPLLCISSSVSHNISLEPKSRSSQNIATNLLLPRVLYFFDAHLVPDNPEYVSARAVSLALYQPGPCPHKCIFEQKEIRTMGILVKT